MFVIELFLLLAQFLIHFLEGLSVVVFGILTAYSMVAHAIYRIATSHKSAVLHLILSPVIWFFGSTSAIAPLAVSLACAAFTYYRIHLREGVFLSIAGSGLLLTVLIVMWFTGRHKTSSRFKFVNIELFFVMQCFPLALPAAVIDVLSVTRALHLFLLLRKIDHHRFYEVVFQILLATYKCLFYAVLDYLIAPFVFLLLITMVRVPHMLRILSRNQVKRIHLAFVVHSFAAAADLLVIIVAFATCIFLHRIPALITGLIKSPVNQRHKLCLEIIAKNLLDIPAFLGFVFTTVTFYRRGQAANLWAKNPKYTTEKNFHETYIMLLGEFLADIFFFVLAGLLPLITLWRAPTLIWRWYCADAEYKRDALRSTYLSWCNDIECVLESIILLATGYRFFKLIGAMISLGPHKGARHQFICLMKDLPVIAMCILSLWRFPYTVYLVLKGKDHEERFATAKHQMIEAWIDVPFVIAVILLVACIMHISTLYRRYMRQKAENTADSWRKYRITMIMVAISLPLQTPILLCFYLVLLTGYRLPVLARLARTVHFTKRGPIVMKQSLLLFIDLAALICSLVLTVTVYRFGHLKKILQENSIIQDDVTLGGSMKAHKLIFKQFWYLIRDIPLFLLALVSCFSIWRIKFITSLDDNYYKKLSVLGLNAFLTLMDIPLILVTLVMLVTWRSQNVRKHLQEAYNGTSQGYLHGKVFAEFFSLVIDIQFILLSLLTLWRLPYVIYHAYKANDAYERRRLVLQNLKGLLSDLPYIGIVVILTLSLYRLRYLYLYLRKSISSKKMLPSSKYNLSIKVYLLAQFLLFLGDLPFILIILVSCPIMPWRLWTIFSALFLTTNDRVRRKTLTVSAGKSTADIASVFMMAFAIACVWRIPFIIYDFVRTPFTWQHIAARQAKFAALDIACVYSVIHVHYTVYHIPRFYSRMYKLISFAYKTWKDRPVKKPFVPKPIKADNGFVLPEEMLITLFGNLSGLNVARNMERTCKYWNQVALKDVVWDALVKQEFMNRKTNVAPANDFVIAFNQSFGSGNTKKKYVESYLRKYPKKPKVTQEYERDYEKGWRNTIFELMGEALQQIYRFFLLPYKVLFPIVLPLFQVFQVIIPSRVNDIPSLKGWDYMEFDTLGMIAVAFSAFIAKLSRAALYSCYAIDVVIFFGYNFWRPSIMNDHVVGATPLSTFRKIQYTIIRVVVDVWQVILAVPRLLLVLGIIFSPLYLPVRVVLYDITSSVVQHLVILAPFLQTTYDYIVMVLYYLPVLRFHAWNVTIQVALIKFAVSWAWFLLSYVLFAKFVFFPLWAIGNGYVLFDTRVRIAPDIQTPLGGMAFAAISVVVSYLNLLVFATRMCSKVPILGQLVLLVFSICWMFIPLYFAYHIGYVSVWIICLIVSGWLCIIGVDCMKLQKYHQYRRF